MEGGKFGVARASEGICWVEMHVPAGSCGFEMQDGLCEKLLGD